MMCRHLSSKPDPPLQITFVEKLLFTETYLYSKQKRGFVRWQLNQVQNTHTTSRRIEVGSFLFNPG